MLLAENKDFPTVGLETNIRHRSTILKNDESFLVVHNHYLEDAEWLMKADDDTSHTRKFEVAAFKIHDVEKQF